MTCRLVRIASLAFWAVLANALVAPVSSTDKTGNSTTQQLAASGYARWVAFVTCASGTTGCTGNVAVVRVGGSNTNATTGIPITPGGGLFFPPIPVDYQQPVVTNNYYDLTAIYWYAQTGDKVSITWGF